MISLMMLFFAFAGIGLSIFLALTVLTISIIKYIIEAVQATRELIGSRKH